MKKIIISAVLLLVTSTMAIASISDDRSVSFAQLPQKAQQFIKQYFPTAEISYAKQDTDLFDGDYEVIFTNGEKIEFKKNGEWKDVESNLSEVPAGIIPARLKTFVSQRHADQKIVAINRDRTDFEIKLTNGKELKFSLKGDFIGYDD